MKKSSTKTRVRYSETDQMGVVYHGNYAQFFEIGRTEWLRSLGVTYKDMEMNGIILNIIGIAFIIFSILVLITSILIVILDNRY